jgi:hypothetical protein
VAKGVRRLRDRTALTVESMKTIRGEPGETVIRPSDRWADRGGSVVAVCLLLAWGAGVYWRLGDDLPGRASGAGTLWLIFAIWLTSLSLACARAAWNFFGATRISVSADELVVERRIGPHVISASEPIQLSTIRDVRVEERKLISSNYRRLLWVLIVGLEDGRSREVAKFTSSLDANLFMSRYVQGFPPVSPPSQ